jgi:hypothetical protein
MDMGWCNSHLAPRASQGHHGHLVSVQKPNRFHFFHSQPKSKSSTLCSIEPIHASGGWWLMSTVSKPNLVTTPKTFMEMLHSWGNTWLWEHISVTGGYNWLQEVIKNTMVTVTDGSYLCEEYTHICSAAFMVECAEGKGHLIGFFLEALLVANAYRGELHGLMATNLILLSWRNTPVTM